MTTIELQQWRESFVERYLNKIDDMEISEELERAAKKIFSKRRDRKSTRLNSSHPLSSRMPSSA